MINETAAQQELRLASCNASSCLNKLETIRTFLSTHHPDIVTVQETHLVDGDNLEFLKTSLSRYHLFTNNATASTRGTMVLIKKDTVSNLVELDVSPTPNELIAYPTLESGRVNMIEVTFCKFTFILVNVYCPNSAAQREDFFQWLLVRLLPLNLPFILMGDWNTVESPFDRSTNGFSPGDNHATAINFYTAL
jgi:exonuclease III